MVVACTGGEQDTESGSDEPSDQPEPNDPSPKDDPSADESPVEEARTVVHPCEVRTLRYGPEGILHQQTTTRFNAAHDLIEFRTTNLIGESWKFLYTYDADGLLLREETVSTDIPAVYTTYTNDDAGNLARKETFDARDEPIEHSTYEYDEAGNLLSATDYDTSEVAIREEAWTYDADGNALSQTIDDPFGGAIDSTFVFTNDSDGNRTRTEQSDANGERFFSVATYDEGGRLLTETSYNTIGNAVQWAHVYTYDQELLSKKSEISYTATGEIDSERFLRFTYDEFSQSTVRIHEIDGEVFDERHYENTYDCDWIE